MPRRNLLFSLFCPSPFRLFDRFLDFFGNFDRLRKFLFDFLGPFFCELDFHSRLIYLFRYFVDKLLSDDDFHAITTLRRCLQILGRNRRHPCGLGNRSSCRQIISERFIHDVVILIDRQVESHLNLGNRIILGINGPAESR